MKIDIDASEFLDRIEEQLSWLAVAGSCVNEYQEHGERISKGTWFFTEHFRCANPWISLGGDDSACLEFDGGLDAQVAVKVKSLDHLDRAQLLRLFASMYGELRRPLRHADVREGRSLDGVNPKAHFLCSVAALSTRDNFKRGPLRGMSRIWIQGIELVSDRPPSRECVSVEDYGLRQDRKEILNPDTGRPERDPTLVKALIMAVADQLRSEERWRVELSMSKGRTGLAIETDAVGARDLVKSMRREPSRRALVHWVRSHYRQRRGGGDASLVREHLRGSQFAVTGHLHATIWPSTADIDRASNGGRFEDQPRSQP